MMNLSIELKSQKAMEAYTMFSHWLSKRLDTCGQDTDLWEKIRDKIVNDRQMVLPDVLKLIDESVLSTQETARLREIVKNQAERIVTLEKQLELAFKDLKSEDLKKEPGDFSIDK